MKKRIAIMALTAAAVFSGLRTNANDADDAVRLRHDAQTLDRMIQADKDAAEKRYDDAHPSSSGSSSGGEDIGGDIVVLGVVLFGAFLFFKFFMGLAKINNR